LIAYDAGTTAARLTRRTSRPCVPRADLRDHHAPLADATGYARL
jgi:hypothetical protein